MKGDKRYNSLMLEARIRIAEMDKTDGGPISLRPIDRALRTVMSALDYAIRTKKWDGVQMPRSC